ncbi:MAG: helix-turn-helix domain-containing protein [Acidimicrobiia bacterium]
MPDPQVHVVEDPSALQALSHPLRLQMLEALRTPASAAAVGRLVRQSRQNVSYHLKELEKAGLVRRVGERRSGTFVESLFQAVAPTVLVSPRATWGDHRRLETLRSQMALEQLVSLGDGLQRDAASLLDRAAFDGEVIPSAAVQTKIRLATENERAEFMREYLAAIAPLVTKYGKRRGAPYRLSWAIYPDPHPAAEDS